MKTLTIVTLLAVLAGSPVSAKNETTETDSKELPWDRGYVQLGAFLMTVDSSFRVGLSNVGLGIELDEDALEDKIDHDWRNPESYHPDDNSVVDW